MPAGLNVPGSAKIGTNYTTAKNLTQLTADANFAGTVYLTAPVIPTANLTLTCDLRPVHGAVITLGSYNLAINSPFHAGLYQCFDQNGSGVVTFGGNVPRIIPQWWGASPTTATSTAVLSGPDDTAATDARLRVGHSACQRFQQERIIRYRV